MDNLTGLIETLNRVASSVDFNRTEILVQDDASPDIDLTRIVGFPPFKSERNAHNLGFIKNVNQAAKRAQGDYLCLLNQDCKPLTQDWLDTMLALIARRRNIGVVGPKLLFPDGSIQSCGGIYDGNKNPWHRNLGWKDANDWRVNTTQPVSWVTGACLMISRIDFWKCGGLNDIDLIFGYFDDPWICNQVRYELHKEVYYCAEAVLEHSVGSTGGSKHFLHNLLAFHKKWDGIIDKDTDQIFAPW